MPIKKAVLIFFIATTQVEAAECTQLEGYAAERVTDYLNNWHNLYLAYSQFGHCDDGAVGEGFSAAISRLLVDQWPKLNELSAYAMNDRKFENFVIRHIDETVTTEDLLKINENAKSECPSSAVNLCNKIAAASTN
jgi:hypothetical protein